MKNVYCLAFHPLVLACLRPEGGGGRGVKKFDFLILCLWLTLVEADLLEPKLGTKEIALTQKMRFTFFIEI